MKRFILTACALVSVGVLGQAFFFNDVAFVGNANQAASGSTAADSLDTFNRANAASITGSTMSDGVGIWDGVSGRTACNITDNECSSDGTDRMNCVHTEGVGGANCNYNDNQWASVAIGTSGAGGYMGVLLRVDAATGAGYACIVNGSTTAIAIYEMPDMTLLDSATITALVAGDVLRCEISGGDFTWKVNGTQVDTYTDASPLTGGQPGAYSNNFFDVDDFRCGNL